MPNDNTAPGARPDAVVRILEGAADQLRATGPGGFSLQVVADRAGVSKALIHYHFDTRERLLARLVEWVGAGIVERQRRSLEGAVPAAAIDAWWLGFEAELARGHLRILTELASEPGADVRAALARVRRERRREATARVAALFRMLALTPSVPLELIADIVLAFEHGLASEAIGEAGPPRARFDVLWLAILSLTE